MCYLRRIRKDSKLKNQGITLVEVIITLLIIMIIFVPLLSGFTASSKTNLVTKEKMYASNLADNLMEAVKVLGIEGVAQQFYQTDPAAFLLGEGTSLIYGEDRSSGVSSSIKVDSHGNKIFDSSRKTSSYVYQIKGVQEGTGTYDATITFSSASYTAPAVASPSVTPAALPNDYQYADLSAFNSESTALINPKISGTDYDYLAKQYFKQLHESYYYDMWVEACEAVNRANEPIYLAYDHACDEAIAAGNPMPSMPSVAPLPTQKATLNEASLNARITKTTTLELSKVVVDNVNNIQKYNLNSYVSYSFNNLLVTDGIVEGLCADPSSSVIIRNYAGYCDNVQSTLLNSIFLMYTPFISASYLTQEKVQIENQISENFDIYLVIQAPVSSTFAPNLKVELSGYDNKLNLYSQAPLTVSGNPRSTSNATTEADRLLKELSSDKARIYEVTINVYESGSGFTNLFQTLSSTVISE
ncbi:MAG: hypothetical protein K0S01_2091 [Herbinix sp.]|jgi:type II secretory pathway pseudopilin PulG|nr:hypothetical protein [Herbinix sp.]